MEEWVQARYLTTTGELLVFTDYEVSNLGNVRNKKTNKILSALHNQGGYCMVHPHLNGKQKNCLIHRLVLSSFTDNVDDSLDVNHKDENKDNNTLTNLEWMTAKENLKYGTRIERMAKGHSKYVLQYDKSGNFIREWSSMKEVERQLGIANQSICACCKGKRNFAGGFVWRYK